MPIRAMRKGVTDRGFKSEWRRSTLFIGVMPSAKANGESQNHVFQGVRIGQRRHGETRGKLEDNPKHDAGERRRAEVTANVGLEGEGRANGGWTLFRCSESDMHRS